MPASRSSASTQQLTRDGTLGFPRVYEYAAGEADWLAFGFPSEGRDANTPRVGQIARRDVLTCAMGDRLGDVRDRIRATGWDECLVMNEQRVVLGRLRAPALTDDATKVVEEIMEPGPGTVRPDESLATLASRLRDKHVARIIVTTPDGRLVGIAERETVERACRARTHGERS